MFKTIKQTVSRHFDQMREDSSRLLQADIDRDEIWQVYLDAFPEELRQEHNCSCCRAFIRQAGGVVTINDDLERTTIWSLRGKEVPPEFVASMDALEKYVLSRPIVGLWYSTERQVGTDRTPDPVNNVVWEHFHVKTPSNAYGDMASRSGHMADTKGLLERGLKELTPEALSITTELIEQGSLYRGNTHQDALQQFSALSERFRELPEEQHEDFLWFTTCKTHEVVCRLRNTSLGTMLVDLSEGMELEAAVRRYEKVMAPENYKRPTALVTPRMVESAKSRLEELGLISALDRRLLDARDLSAADALFVHRPQSGASDVFSEITGDMPANLQELSKVERIGVDDFIENVVPKAKGMRVLFERQHMGNLVALTGPQDPDANNLMNWDNSFGWSYSGGVADSIKAKVKEAGGNVDGWMRISLEWYNYDDLDLHLFGYNDTEHVYFRRMKNARMNADLDVDENANHGKTREPVENIHIAGPLEAGTYHVSVHQYERRETDDPGFEVEIEVGGETYSFGMPKSPQTHKHSPRITFDVNAAGDVSFKENELSKHAAGTVKWGLKTGRWHTVKALTLSPNHWTKPRGNKHWFFLLEGCVADERIRPFYNEFLTQELAKDRKVSEVLANKIQVAPAEGAELSGLGFSETVRNHVYVEVDGAFKRTLKVVF